MATFKCLIFTLMMNLLGEILALHEVSPKISYKVSDQESFGTFGGKDNKKKDHFRSLLVVGDTLLVGGRDYIYNLNLTNLAEMRHFHFPSSVENVQMCMLKGKNEEGCSNYIRLMMRTENDLLLICGTYAFKPLCKVFNYTDNILIDISEKHGQAIVAYDPLQNSTSVYVDGRLYTGTVADFSGMDPIIYSEPLQTEQYDLNSLNEPNFVGSMAIDNFIYFFFRETAVEYINCGKAIFSRVARVCKSDKGGPHRFRNRWTTFLKARLNCSVPGDFPFYFDEIQATSDLIRFSDGVEDDIPIIYATFTTPPNSIAGSAVCAYKIMDINDTFEGNFKEQEKLNSNWLPVNNAKVPVPRPGSCTNNSAVLPDQTLTFVRTHTLMDESVPAFLQKPIVVKTGIRFTQIVVDQVVNKNGSYDVLFIGTDNGTILKAINGKANRRDEGVETVIIEDRRVFEENVAVRNLQIVRKGDKEKMLIAVSDTQVKTLKLHSCDHIQDPTSCFECKNLRDPYCAWHGKKCISIFSSEYTEQSDDFACGQEASSGATTKQINHHRDETGNSNTDLHPGGPTVIEDPGYSPVPPSYSTETLALAIAAGALVALAIGFVTGYFCGRKCHKDEDDNIPYPDTEYEYFEQRQNINRIQAEPKLLSQVEEVTYAEPVLAPPGGQMKAPHSPHNTLRKTMHPHYAHPQSQHPSHPGLPPHAETLFQFQQPDGPAGYRQGRDNFGTLRSHQVDGDGYRRGNDGFSTTRSVKKVYL